MTYLIASFGEKKAGRILREKVGERGRRKGSEVKYEATDLWMVFAFAAGQAGSGEGVARTAQETTQEKILAL
ncbi:MAG: hypothetical protein P1P81_11335, partial [Desulfobulbales bacterium]|nr:hypothetical protein [Desulfobulbales bacterium]